MIYTCFQVLPENAFAANIAGVDAAGCDKHHPFCNVSSGLNIYAS
jgi:hypothetical protein